MKINLHVTEKTIKEDGNVSISLTPILLEVPEGTTLSSGPIILTIPASQDTFMVGKDYQGEFSEITN